ncbi:MAG: hypothetical protein AAF399_09395 [Bacteroidota bacterium]
MIRPVLFLCCLIATHLLLAQPAPLAFRGSFPADAQTEVLRNAVVTVWFHTSGEKRGIDPWSITEQSVRLYPASLPDSGVEILIQTPPKTPLLVVEPVALLAEHTVYLLEISDSLLDENGQAVQPHRIQFRTNGQALPKYVSLDRPELGPKPTEAIAEADGQRYVHQLALPAAYIPPAEVPEIADESAEPTPLPTEESSASKALADSAIQEPAEALPPLPLAESISFPNLKVKAGENLSLRFHFRQTRKIQYMVQSAGGKTVKRGTTTIPSDWQVKQVPLKGLSPGKYRVSIKVGEEILRQVFQLQP